MEGSLRVKRGEGRMVEGEERGGKGWLGMEGGLRDE